MDKELTTALTKKEKVLVNTVAIASVVSAAPALVAMGGVILVGELICAVGRAARKTAGKARNVHKTMYTLSASGVMTRKIIQKSADTIPNTLRV